MASRTSVVPWRYQQLSALLCSVLLEWILMLLLLLERLFSYLATTFAHICKLQPPCPMCTRIDHVLGKAQPGFYRDLMCSSHKAEASSWAFCRIHQKLVHVHSMCEDCLLSFATDNKSNLETYQSLVGKLGDGIKNVGYRNSFNLRHDASEASAMKKDTLCSCCSRPLKLKSYPFVVLKNETSGIGIEEVCRGVSRFHQHVDEINYVAYSELKTSDSESEPWHLGGNAESFIILDHPQTNIAKGIPLYDNSLENIPGQSELILVRNGGSYCKPSENIGEMSGIQIDSKANLQSTDLPIKDGHQTTEDSDTRLDKSENDVWHSACGSTEELPVAATTPAETNTMEGEKRAELTHTPSLKNSFNVHEDLKLLLSQLSNTSLAPDIDSPIVHDQSEHAILHNISRALSFQRNDSGISESTVNEVEVECTIDRLKRQIELDRQSISRLCKELDEERNASAVAANQTMAMITRLQEEKAAMQMEALQYQRMMEEQSEYDREDLQKMTEMVQTLQAELESYKGKLRDQLLVDEIRDHMRLSRPKEHESVISRATLSLSCFEDEKAYISKRLKKLKQKLHQFSNNSKHIPSSKLGDIEEDSVDIEDVYEDDVEQGEKSDPVSDNNIRRNGTVFGDLTHGEDDPKGQYHAMVSENDLASFEEEISEVSGRLLALEADRSFLEHSVNSLRNGKEGEELIRDIACSLRELRKMGITWKEYD
ncbi:hypothetical protein QOZ80_3BG0257500 [Eleusine coracana subsp. coracana]|nr:hypothetical protein QOZ80_3BG0257500 [Eleusine coracana subsp. coracana]